MNEQKQAHIIKGTEHTEEFQQKEECPNPDCRDGKEQVPYGHKFHEWHWIDCKICKGTGRITNKVEWDREKVAKWLYNYTDWADTERDFEDEGWAEDADQLHKILTGGE